jgi:hypothetical protein
MMASIPFTDFCIPDSVTLSISPVALKKSILNRSWCDLAVWENGEQAEQSARTGWALRDQARVMTDGTREGRTLEQVGGALDVALHVDAHQLIGRLRIGPGGRIDVDALNPGSFPQHF